MILVVQKMQKLTRKNKEKVKKDFFFSAKKSSYYNWSEKGDNAVSRKKIIKIDHRAGKQGWSKGVSHVKEPSIQLYRVSLAGI